jgi:hypothetical protein
LTPVGLELNPPGFSREGCYQFRWFVGNNNIQVDHSDDQDADKSQQNP